MLFLLLKKRYLRYTSRRSYTQWHNLHKFSAQFHLNGAYFLFVRRPTRSCCQHNLLNNPILSHAASINILSSDIYQIKICCVISNGEKSCVTQSCKQGNGTRRRRELFTAQSCLTINFI